MSSVLQPTGERNDSFESFPQGPTPTVVVAHRDESISAEIRDDLEQHGLDVIGEARDAAQAAWLVVRRKPAVCLLDDEITLSDVALEEIRIATPSVKVAILADSASDREVMAALQEGADGYLLKSIEPDRLAAAVKALARGEATFPRTFTSLLVDEMRFPPKRSLPHRLGRTVAYPFRLARHYRRRRKMDMSVSDSLTSARRRMRAYG